jgi:signal transduction histidine kinase
MVSQRHLLFGSLSDRARTLIGRTTAVGVAVVGLTSAGVYLLLGRAADLYDDWILHNVLLGSLGLGVLVWLALPRQPRNGAVWALLWSAVFQTVNAGAQAWTMAAAEAADLAAPVSEIPLNDLPLSVAIPDQLAAWSWVPGLFLMLTLVLLLLPDGRLPSSRWRPIAWGSVGLIGVIAFSLFWLTRPGQEAAGPVGDLEVPGPIGLLFGALLVMVGASMVSLIVRYRGGNEEEKIRLRWIVWGSAVFGLGAISLLFDLQGDGGGFRTVSLVTGSVWITATTVAITKHRLYEIDVVVNKTLMITALAGVIFGLYVAIVFVAGRLLGLTGGSQFYVQVAATVVAGIAFGPVRRRAREWANRLVYGKRASPYEVLARFSRRASGSSDEELLSRIPRLIVDGTGAVEATLWVRSPDGFAPASAWPEDVVRDEIRSVDNFTDPAADYSVPVIHDGESLGGISLAKARGEALAPTEEQLVANLAAGIGLALRNSVLTSQLREQVTRLEASRERIMAAGDEARRTLEHDLDSGPQQQLVALKVMLGPVRMQAEAAGAVKTVEMLAELERDAGEAITAVREFSGGVYPALLEAEGLAVALVDQARKAALPIAIDVDGVGRYSREVEAAVYFAILEALQNSAKYADASGAQVTLADSGGHLSFEVSDDGVGFELDSVVVRSGLTNMIDRLDAVSGNLEIESSPGSGTVVRGAVPVGA